MADKDIGERALLKESLPQAEVLFHALHTFHHEITCEKCGITSGQRTLCLELIQNMADATSVSTHEGI